MTSSSQPIIHSCFLTSNRCNEKAKWVSKSTLLENELLYTSSEELTFLSSKKCLKALKMLSFLKTAGIYLYPSSQNTPKNRRVFLFAYFAMRQGREPDIVGEFLKKHCNKGRKRYYIIKYPMRILGQ